ncbi:hypothetical protein EDB80DRAFT_710715 [Ilyonectria destructans]|nr:hypothetical protein EDB80DRAFT_710715 [Ilyonectria destructans]
MARSGHYLRNLVSQAVSDSRTATGRLTTEIEQPHVFRRRIVSQAERALPVRSTVPPPIVTLLMPKLLCFIIADTNAHLLNTGDDVKPTPQIPAFLAFLNFPDLPQNLLALSKRAPARAPSPATTPGFHINTMLIPQILGVRPARQQIQPSLSRATPGLRFQISGADEIGKFFFGPKDLGRIRRGCCRSWGGMHCILGAEEDYQLRTDAIETQLN